MRIVFRLPSRRYVHRAERNADGCGLCPEHPFGNGVHCGAAVGAADRRQKRYDVVFLRAQGCQQCERRILASAPVEDGFHACVHSDSSVFSFVNSPPTSVK